MVVDQLANKAASDVKISTGSLHAPREDSGTPADTVNEDARKAIAIPIGTLNPITFFADLAPNTGHTPSSLLTRVYFNPFGRARDYLAHSGQPLSSEFAIVQSRWEEIQMIVGDLVKRFVISPLTMLLIFGGAGVQVGESPHAIL
jgi:hypothetical protein